MRHGATVSRCRILFPTGTMPDGKLNYRACGQLQEDWQLCCSSHWRDLARSAPQLADKVSRLLREDAYSDAYMQALRQARSHLEVRERLKYEGSITHA